MDLKNKEDIETHQKKITSDEKKPKKKNLLELSDALKQNLRRRKAPRVNNSNLDKENI